MPRVRIDPERLARALVLSGYSFVSIDQLANMLGISTRSAGRILAELRRRGLAKRWSRRTYKLTLGAVMPE